MSAVPTRVHVRGDEASAVPPVLVMTMVPLAIASLRVYETSDEVVMLLMEALVAGAVEEMTGTVVSITKALFAARLVVGT